MAEQSSPRSEDLQNAFTAAIKEIGISELKKCSFFGRNNK